MTRYLLLDVEVFWKRGIIKFPRYDDYKIEEPIKQ